MTVQHTAAAITGTDPYKTEITIGDSAFIMMSDAPTDAGGNAIAPSPTELATASLAACKTMTAMMYANRKQWPLEAIQIDVRHVRKEIDGRKRDAFECDITIKGDLDADQRARLVDITTKCPVSKMLETQTPVESSMSPSED